MFLQASSDPHTAKALPEEESTALPGVVPYLLAVLMPWRVHEAVVVEESHLLADQAVHDVGPGILPLQQACQGAVQVGPQVWGPVVSVERQLEREEQEEALRTCSERACMVAQAAPSVLVQVHLGKPVPPWAAAANFS